MTPCCSKVGLKRGPWTPEEDEVLANYIKKEGEGRWRTLPKRAGLLRCGKSCRLRWMNYLRPSVKRGHIAPDEEDLILRLHRLLGNRIPGRTDNEIKNYWNTHLSKKLISQGIDPRTHKPLLNSPDSSSPPHPRHHPHDTKPSSSSKPMMINATQPPPTPSPNPNHSTPSNLTDDQQPDNDIPADFLQINNNNNNNSNIIHKEKENENENTFFFHATIVANNDDHDHYPIQTPDGIGIGTATPALVHHIHPYHPNFPSSSDHDEHHCSPSNINHAQLPGNDDDINYCPDDVFSSFLNSLINDDAFAAQAQHQLLLQHPHPNPNPNPTPTSAPPALSDPNLISTSATATATAPTTTYALPTTTWDSSLLSSTTTTFNHNHPNSTIADDHHQME
ncbi:hypothetical protein FEM48_Zijuj04G0003700 [Ziziphus jujuba var. spinosa]|uniref:Uncharacterized protein n=1 Tax=Ziziphus jujuba var. spinosa TaxID=714518 RepID=A0A978VGR7_ZIZJJ|nr:hypothetical protein FEM48_Zijuj04G0003700 [Ziziphus jujuba var. spinosa]